jgi:glycosyltransferase involved in cell wall biosynthesis
MRLDAIKAVHQESMNAAVQMTVVDTSVDVSVILCTYNRSESLAKALESIAASAVPETVAWEVLVVDNNSKDGTRAVAEDFSARYPGRFRYLFEPRQGKSYALNGAIRESRGRVLAFVDDDVIVEPAWLHNLTSVLFDGQWSGSGGRILPPPGYAPPRWLALSGPRNLGMVLCAQFDLGLEAAELTVAPFGTNMAFRKEMFDLYGDFRTDLGPRPDSEIRNEDIEFAGRLLSGGDRLRYVPSAVVYHEVKESRVDKRFFLNWWFDRGRAAIRESGKIPGAREILKLFARTLPTACGSILSFDPERRFYRKCMVWHAAGKLAEIRMLAKSPASAASHQPRL